MTCSRCSSARIVQISAKCSDLCYVQIGNRARDGYVPEDLGLGGGDYLRFNSCLDCGQIQGTFPLPVAELEDSLPDECGDWGSR